MLSDQSIVIFIPIRVAFLTAGLSKLSNTITMKKISQKWLGYEMNPFGIETSRFGKSEKSRQTS